MSKEAFVHALSKYLPADSIELVYDWLRPHKVKLKITQPRSSKLGDFRVDSRREPVQISVNGNLNPYAFLITLTHEIAHLRDFKERNSLREAHGASWKSHYQALLLELRSRSIFPAEILSAIDKHIYNPKAASCSDVQLLEALRIFDEKPALRIKDLEDGAVFALLGGRAFKRGELRRTRYRCQELDTNRWFLIHGEAEVLSVGETKS